MNKRRHREIKYVWRREKEKLTLKLIRPKRNSKEKKRFIEKRSKSSTNNNSEASSGNGRNGSSNINSTAYSQCYTLWLNNSNGCARNHSHTRTRICSPYRCQVPMCGFVSVCVGSYSLVCFISVGNQIAVGFVIVVNSWLHVYESEWDRYEVRGWKWGIAIARGVVTRKEG